MRQRLARWITHQLVLRLLKDPDIHLILCHPCPKGKKNGTA